MTHTLSIAVAVAFVALACIHVYWALGGKLDIRKMVPVVNDKPLFTPGPVGTFVVAVGLIGFALVVLALGFYDSVPVHYQSYFSITGYVIGTVLILRAMGEFKYVGFFKRVRGSDFATYDSWLYSPFCLSAGCAFLFLAAHRN